MDTNIKGMIFGRSIRNVSRMAQIVNVFARHGLWSILARAGVQSWLTPEQVRDAEEISRAEGQDLPSEQDASEPEATNVTNLPTELPARLRAAMEELGPAFVKLGQMLASRADILPEKYIREFQKLHKDVATLPYSTIQKILESELGKEGLEQFTSIDEKPLAAGSIGQVHTATLKDGRRVVVKVQRPNIVESIRTDLALMEVLAGLLEKYLPDTKSIRPRITVEEFTRGLLAELDFIREGGNTTKIAENFTGVAYIKIPEVFWQLTTAKVLTLSFIDGYQITEKKVLVDAGLEPTMLVERGLNCFLQMVFVDGFYHGDLHAGNLLALPGNHIGILDFGLTIKLGRSSREHLAGLLVALVDEDYESVVSHFLELSDPAVGFDINSFEEDLGGQLAPFVGLKLSQIPWGKLLLKLAHIAAEHGAPMPRQMIAFFRTLASFEGIGTRLDPSFDIIKASQKFSQTLVKEMYSPENIRRQSLLIMRDVAALARHAPRQVRGLLKTATEGNLTLNITSADLRFTASSLNRLASRLSVSLILASLIVASSILVLAKAGHEYHSVSALGLIGFAIAGILGLYVVGSMIRGGGSKF